MDAFTVENSILVNLDFTIWTGRAKLDVSDVPAAAGIMPPKDLYNSGSIKIFDTDYIKPFRNFKTRADICVSALGLKVRGFEGWLVDEQNISQLESELDAIHSAWEDELIDFTNHYGERARQWALDNGTWEHLIRQKQPNPMEISKRFNFGWWTMRITPETAHAASGNTTADVIQGIPDQALQSLVDSLKELYDDSFNKSNDPSPKAYNALKKIAQRAQALGFANPNAARLAPVLLDIVNRRNHTLARLVLSRMDNPQSVLDVLQINAGQGIDSLLTPAMEIQSEQERQKQPVFEEAHTPEPFLDHNANPVATGSLLEQAKILLNNAPPLVSVNGQGQVVDNATGTVLMPAQEANEIAQPPYARAVAKLREQFAQGKITVDEYNAIGEWVAKSMLPADVGKNLLLDQHPEPEIQKPVSSMDVLDSLGLF